MNNKFQMKDKIICIQKFIFILIILLFSLTGCGNQYTEFTQRSSKTACDDWGIAATGSAKYLDGNTLLVSIFLIDKSASWSGEDYKLVDHNLDIAVDFLKEQGKEYGKNVNLIYNTAVHSDLQYTMYYDKSFSKTFHDEDDGKLTEEAMDLYSSTMAFINTNIDSVGLMEKYGVDSIGYLVYIDNISNVAVTFSYEQSYGLYYYPEIAFLNLRWTSTKENVTPDIFAHEILHLFGARDLYVTSKEYGISKDLVNYAYKKYPKDIMLGNSSKGVSWNNKITHKITDITAYYLGWDDYINELQKFPDMKQKYPGVFTRVTNPTENFEKYELPTKRVPQKRFFTNLIVNIICVGVIIYSAITTYRRNKKENYHYDSNSSIGYSSNYVSLDDSIIFSGFDNGTENKGE